MDFIWAMQQIHEGRAVARRDADGGVRVIRPEAPRVDVSRVPGLLAGPSFTATPEDARATDWELHLEH
ncbi:hypothetical protein [Phenylobacterium sp.]|jgi:crotonobetainyl-CoA:carnitine CoA-transferase CaiB-like acyl-CoA transferase|uniref:hypothetical protein n=1 Tax=Phenylobacterium sp. TaxID=1871053 RepID=UPI002F933B52